MIFSFTNKIPISETAIKILLGDFSLIISRRSPFQRSKKKNVFIARPEDGVRPFFACGYQEFLFLLLCTRVPSRNA